MTSNDPNSHDLPAAAGDGLRRTADSVTDAAPADPAPDLADLLKKAEAEVADLRDAFLRARAETDNVRKQAQADVARAHKYAIEKFAEDLLPVKDALEQTLAAENASPDTLRVRRRAHAEGSCSRRSTGRRSSRSIRSARSSTRTATRR